MSGVTVRGVTASVRWGYAEAATLLHYTVTRQEGRWSARGTLARLDPFQMAQSPLVFVAPHAKGEWRWPILGCDYAGETFTATLGPPEG
jgi:hypothetical protein